MNIDEVTVFKCCQIKFTSLLKFWRTLGEGRARERKDLPGLYLRYRISSMREVSKPEEQMEVLIYLLTNLLI